MKNANNNYSVTTGLCADKYNIPNYYLPGTFFPSIVELLNDAEINERILPPAVRSILQIVYLYNMRISELLSCRFSDILTGDRVFINGLKGSNDYIIWLPELSSQLDKCESINLESRIFNVAYQKVYNWSKKARCGEKTSGNKNTSRTHNGRYQIANILEERNQIDSLTSILRHKSEKSKHFYLNKKVAHHG